MSDLLAFALGLFFLSLPVLLLIGLVRMVKRRISPGGSASPQPASRTLRRGAKTLCFDCRQLRPVIAVPTLIGADDEIGIPAWRVPLDLPMPEELADFLASREEWIAGLCEKYPVLFGEDGPDWDEFADFLNRQIEQAGLRRGRIFRRRVRVSKDFVRQLAFRYQMSLVWESIEAWLDDWIQDRGPGWIDDLPSELVATFQDGWERALTYVEWYAITHGIKLKSRRVKKEAQRIHTAHLDALRSSELIAHARQLAVTIEQVDAMDPYDFESFLGEVYGSLGYLNIPTPKSGDQGADVLLEKMGERTVIQAKLYSQPVGNKAVQEVIAAREHFRCHRAAVVTNNGFTRSAHELASSAGIDLVDREGLAELLDAYNASRAC